jgi:hypothetical protein
MKASVAGYRKFKSPFPEQEDKTMRDTLNDVTDRYRDRRMNARVNTLDRQNVRLRDEVSCLREDLNDERSERADLKKALQAKPTVVKKTGLIRLLLVGGTAYVLGTRDGRQRYDQIVGWVRSMRGKMERSADDAAAEVTATAVDVSDRAERAVSDTQAAAPRQS